MKLSNEYWNILTNYPKAYEQVKDELNKIDKEGYWGKTKIIGNLRRNLFELEDRDFERAILLCKEYKRSIEKKSYELKFQEFKQGTYRGDYVNFISELYSELCGSRRTNYKKIELINKSMSEHFPEWDEMKCADALFNVIVSHSNQIRKLEEEEREMEDMNVLAGTILMGHQEGKSVVEVQKEVRSRQKEQENRWGR